MILLDLKNSNGNNKNKLIEYAKSHPNITFMVDCTGKWNIILTVHSGNHEQFSQIYSEFKEKFADIIKKDQILTVEKKQKHLFNPRK